MSKAVGDTHRGMDSCADGSVPQKHALTPSEGGELIHNLTQPVVSFSLVCLWFVALLAVSLCLLCCGHHLCSVGT